jgi:hypothetical protein
MKLKAMLTVDLKNCTSEQRIIFNKEMELLKWAKHKSLTTLWTASFLENVAETDAFLKTKSDLVNATTKAKITKYDVAVMFSEYNMREYVV